jgi:flagellar biosynthesis protein FliR
MAPGVVETLVGVLEGAGIDLRAWGLAWARVAPSVLLIPAFGLRALPTPARIALGLSLAAGIAPALGPAAAQGRPWLVLFVVELARGLPVALTASTALWAASMAGGLVDDLRGARESSGLPNVDPGSGPTGALLAMLVAIAFLESGGPARVASVLADPALGFSDPLARAAANLSGGIELAVAVAAPVVAASIVIGVASSLIVRAASPAYVEPLLAPLRSLVVLAVAALVLDRMLELLALSARAALR